MKEGTEAEIVDVLNRIHGQLWRIAAALEGPRPKKDLLDYFMAELEAIAAGTAEEA